MTAMTPMRRPPISRAFQLAPLLVALLLASGISKPAAANSCGSDLIGCFSRAGTIDSLLDRWLAGLNCELSYADCVGDALAR